MENCKKLKTGDKVLVFEKYENMNCLDNENYIKGTVIETLVSKELSNHGNEVDTDLYKVIGENGKIYFGTYKSSIVVAEYVDLLTMEDYIVYLKKVKNNNITKINSILDYNKKIDSFIEKQNIKGYRK